VRRVALGAYAHQDVPFEKLVEELAPEREPGHTPMVRVMFQLQSVRPPAAPLAGLTGSLLDVDTGTSKFDLCLSVVDTGAGLEGTLEYDTDLFDEARMTRLAGHFQSVLRGAVADPGQRLSQLPLLTAEEEHQLLREWSNERPPLTDGDDVERAVANLSPEEVDAWLRTLLAERDADG
jgi:aspartate racemase